MRLWQGELQRGEQQYTSNMNTDIGKLGTCFNWEWRRKSIQKESGGKNNLEDV